MCLLNGSDTNVICYTTDKLRPTLFPEDFQINDGQQFAFGLARKCCSSISV